MKKTNLLFCFIAFSLTFAAPGFSQITITLESFPRMESFVDSIVRSVPGTLPLPSEGPDQLWDYSGLVADELLLNEYMSAAGDPLFPDALNYQNLTFYFQQFEIQADEYDGLDEVGFHRQGRNFTEVAYSITSITGGPNDLLRFLGGPDYFDGRMNYLEFPVTYQSQWTENYSEKFNFELTVAAFGLNNAPGNLTRYFTQDREVVGYGQLVIPHFDGTAGEPMDVLLIKANRQAIDSVYLFGEPAPAILMNAFGLVQGQMASDEFYVFYRQNFGSPVMDVNTIPGIPFYYRPQANDVVTSTNERSISAMQVFPNPLSAGQKLVIQTEQQIPAGYISLRDVSGREVYQERFASDAGKQVQIELPHHLMPGIYFYTLQNALNEILGTGKLQLK